MMKWLKQLFTSRWRKMLISNIGDLRHQVELSNLYMCRLSSKIKDLSDGLNHQQNKEISEALHCLRQAQETMAARDYTSEPIPEPNQSIKDTKGL